jgi:hypothetical protein
MHTAGTVDASPYELRLRSELQTEGIEAVVINSNVSTNEPQALAKRFGVNGIIDVTLTSASEATAWVWVSDSTIALEITRSIRVSLTQRDSVAVFALRCVDLYRGAKLELEQQRRARLPAPTLGTEAATPPPGSLPAPTLAPTPTEVPATQRPNAEEQNATKSSLESAKNVKKSAKNEPSALDTSSPSSKGEWARVGVGVSIMQFTDHLQRRLAPSLSTTLALSEKWAMGVTFAAPFIATILVNVGPDEGLNKVSIDQEFLWLDGRYRWSLSEQFDLEPSLGLGVARYGVSGTGGKTYMGRDVQAYSGLSSVGASLVWRVSLRVRLMTEVACLVRWQTPFATVGTQDETGTSRTNLWGSFGPAWVF